MLVKGTVSTDRSDDASELSALSFTNRKALPHRLAQLTQCTRQNPFVAIELKILPTSVCFKSVASVDEESLASERSGGRFSRFQRTGVNDAALKRL